MRIEQVIRVLDAVAQDFAMVCSREDGALRLSWANAGLEEAMAVAPGGLVGRPFESLLADALDDDLHAWLGAGFGARRPFRGILPFRGRDAATLWGECQASLWRSGPQDAAAAPPEDEHWVCLIRDITTDMDLRDSLADAKAEADRTRARLWAAIEAAPDAFALYDCEDRLVQFNERYRELYASSQAALTPGTRFEDVLREGLDRGQYPEAVGREEQWLAWRMEQHLNPRGPISQELPGDRHLQIRERRTPEGDTVGFRIDVTELKRQSRVLEAQAVALAEQMERIEEVARTDTLTGLGNRRGLDRHLCTLEGRPPPEGAGRAFLHVDLDRFKQINDMYGHAAGDTVLQAVADILRRSVRPSDFVARVGGDEFAIVIEARDVEHVAEGVAARVIEACREPVSHEGRTCHFGASIGIALAPEDGATGGLMENADIALYAAKAAGRNRAAQFTAALRAQAEDTKRLADDLLRGLERGEIRAWYQPQIDAETGAVSGIEALARWHHPERGVILPDDFLHVAEDLDVAGEIDARVLHQGLDTVRWLAGRGLQVPRLSVNVGYDRLVRSDLAAELAQLAPLPCRVAVELLETIHFDREGRELLWVIDGLREAGCEIEIDDFGSGHASLTALLQLRPDRIKIDRRLVATVAQDRDDGSPLVRAIADMARALGIRLAAEGVEEAGQAAALRRLGCDLLQGDLFAPALTDEALAGWLERRAAPALPGGA